MFGLLLPALFGALGGGQARGREGQNAAILGQNRNAIDLYGTAQNATSGAANAHQQALMQALLGQSNEQTQHANIGLDRLKFSRDTPGIQGRQALIGSLLQNLQPVSLSGLSPKLAARTPTFSGGLNASALGPLARQAGLLMQQGAVKGLQNPTQFDPLQRTDFQGGVLDPKRALLPPPAMQSLKNPGFLEQLFSGLGAGTSFLSGLTNPQLPGATPPYRG